MSEQIYDYMIFFDGEWQIPPAFYWVAEVKGKSPEDAITSNLAEIIREARSSYPDIVDGLDDEHIEEALCTVRSTYWTSRHKAAWQSM
jgi:hypothetical protein